MNEKNLDCRGMKCPGPIVKLFQTAKESVAGDVLVIRATDCGFKNDVIAWCQKTNQKLLSVEDEDGTVVARIEIAKEGEE